MDVFTPGEHATAPRVLVISPDAAVRHASALYLRLSAGYAVLASGSLDDALERATGFAPDLLLLDAGRESAVPGLKLRALRERTGAPLVLLACDPCAEALRALRALEPDDMFLMPVEPEELMCGIELVLCRPRA